MSELSYPHIQIIKEEDGFYVFDKIGGGNLTGILSEEEALKQQRKIVEALRLAHSGLDLLHN